MKELKGLFVMSVTNHLAKQLNSKLRVTKTWSLKYMVGSLNTFFNVIRVTDLRFRGAGMESTKECTTSLAWSAGTSKSEN